MGENSEIAWTHHTFNPWWGCARVSPGCEHCYAEQLAVVRRKLPVWGVNADRKPMSEAYWLQPLKWNRDAEKAGARRRVFCASMADVFEVLANLRGLTSTLEARKTLLRARSRLWSLIEQTPWLDWLLLTKRPENISRLVPWGRPSLEGETPKPWPSNVWLGVTAEDQRRADERIPILLSIPARVRFVSYEPALEAVDFAPWLTRRLPISRFEAFTPEAKAAYPVAPTSLVHLGVDWIIVGGESGPKARPFDLAWARSTVRQCKDAGVACFVKQMGARAFEMFPPQMYPDDVSRWHAQVPRERAFLDAKGGDPSEWPEDLRVREFPR